MGEGLYQKNIKSRSKIKNFVWHLAFFSITLFALIYFLFPNKMLKTYLLSELQLALVRAGTPVNIDAQSINLYWFSGLAFRSVKISPLDSFSNSELTIPKLTVRVSLIPLLIGRANLNASIIFGEGTTDFFASSSLFELASGELKNYKITADFNNFPIHDIADLYFNTIKASNAPGAALVKPIISKTSMGGVLEGSFQMQNENALNNGMIQLDFKNLFFDIKDPALKLQTQHFKQASFDIAWKDSIYTIDNKTGFESENLYLKPQGTIRQVGVGANSAFVMDLGLLLILSGTIEKSFGFLVPQLLGCPSSSMTDGVMNVKLAGSLSQYTCH